MGGGAFVGALPLGAHSWCSGDDVIKALNAVFDSDPTSANGPYQVAKTASLALFQVASTSGRWQDLLAAYVDAFDAADPPLCAGWGLYLTALGSLSGIGGNIPTTSSTTPPSAILTFGPGNVPDWMANGLNVSDSTTPGAITSGQTVLTFDNKTVTLTATVDATVNSGDTIVFSLPPGQAQQNIRNIALARYQGLTNNVKMKTFKHHPHDANSSGHVVKVTTQRDGSIWIDSPYIPPGAALRNRTIRELLLRWLRDRRR